MTEIINGVVFPRQPETAVQDPPVLFDTAMHTDLALETFRELGMVADAAAAREVIESNMTRLHDMLAKEGHEEGGELEVFHAIQLPAEAQAGLAFRGLVQAFDKLQGDKSYVYERLWKLYDSGELNQRGLRMVDSDYIPSGEPLGGRALAMYRQTDVEGEAGLRFINKTRREQVRDVKAMQDRINSRRIRVLMMSPADYIMLAAQRRVEGYPLPDQGTLMDQKGPTSTRFIQLGEKYVAGKALIPSVELKGYEVKFTGSRGDDRSMAGVRLVIGERH